MNSAQHIFWLVLLLLVALLVWFVIPSQPKLPTVKEVVKAKEAEVDEIIEQLPNLLNKDGSAIVLDAPQFIGRDNLDRSWKVSAARAFQKRGEAVMNLEQVHVSATSNDDIEVFRVDSPSGIFDDAQNKLIFSNGFSAYVEELNVVGKEAFYNLKNQTIAGRELIVNGKEGRMLSDSFDVDLINNKARLEGNIQMVIILDKKTP